MTNEHRKSLVEVQEYWTKAAQSDLDTYNLRATARDPYLQEVVETAIERWMYPGATLLDIGCGDGLSTLRFAKRVQNVLGVDFIQEYIAKAKLNAATLGASNVDFEAENVLNLSEVLQRRGHFDIVVTIRCLINLVSWDNQANALAEIASCVNPGGLYLTSEGWEDGLVGLNLRRQRAGLSLIKTVEYNRLIPRAQFEQEVSKYFDLIEYISAGFYLYMSRVFQPCFVAPEEAHHRHPINKLAAELQIKSIQGIEFSDCDYAGVYVLRRKD